MRIESFSWSAGQGSQQELIVGEFSEGSDYRTVRANGTDDYLLIQTLLGSGRIEGPLGEVLETEPGVLLLFSPGSYHDYGTSPAAGQWNLLWSHFPTAGKPPDSWLSWENPWPGLRCARIGPVTAQRVADELREVLELPLGGGRLGGGFARTALERIWLRVEHSLREWSVARTRSRLDPALAHVLTHLSEPLSVPALARVCGLSVSRFAHLFRAERGVTPQVFIEDKRMELARKLLRYSDIPVGDVARNCGFDNPLYFSTRFRRHHGCSPRQYRRMSG